MSVQKVEVSVEKEIMDAGALLVAIALKARQKEAALSIIADEFAALVSLLGEIQAIPADIASDKAGSLNAAMIIGSNLVGALTSPLPAK